MLLPVTVMPILFSMLHSASTEMHAAAAPASGGVTILTIILVVLRGTGTVRLWAPEAGEGESAGAGESAGTAEGERADMDVAAGASGEGGPTVPALLLTVRKEDGAAVLKFIVGADGGTSGSNLQDHISVLGETAEEPPPEHGEEMSLRLLHHLASSVRHQQFHGMDVVTLRVLP